MLWQLYIENVAIIEKTSLTFSGGFCVFTGETGAGKSILIDSIGAVLGERVSKEIVRHGAQKAVVSAIFAGLAGPVLAALAELGYECEDDTVMLSREITADGRSSCKINGRPATAAVIKSVAPMLLQIHGQHDTYTLLSQETQGTIMDAYGGLTQQAEEVRSGYRALLALTRERDKLDMDEAEIARQTDLLQYQIEEIERAQLQPGEEETLDERRRLARDSAKIVEHLMEASLLLQGNEESSGAVEQLSNTVDVLRALATYSEELGAAAASIEALYYELEEQARSVRGMTEQYEYDPSEMDEIEGRLDTIYRLKRKYGESIEEILRFQKQAQQQLDALTSNEQRRESLNEQIEQRRALLLSQAQALHERRSEAAERFTAQVLDNLAFLDMPNVRFSVDFQQVELCDNGVDRVEFLISTNPGEDPKPIAKIASGGELSRIMLAIKNVQAEFDEVGALIFDEIDTGVSGRAAQRIGQKLRSVAANRQVICVTHLAQIAAMADEHWYLYKIVENGRTFTQVRLLDRAGRVEELSRILGGANITPLVLQNADEMLQLSGH